MKNFLQVNRALVAEKKHLLLNQLFGTEGSPNQTDETLTRENRIGLMSYLRRTLMLLFAVLVMSMANVGMAWGAITPKTISSSTGEVYVVTPATMNTYYNSGNGWVTNASGGAITSASYYTSKAGTNNTSYINPETEESGTKGQGNGITLKTADDRSARFYFTGAVKASAFIAITGSSRTATITVYKVSDGSSVGSATTSSYGSSGPYEKIEVTGLSSSESYYAKVTATNDLCLYAVKFFAPAAPAAITRRMFLNLGGIWRTDASYKIHAWGDGSSVDYPMTRIGETGIYYADIPISKNMIQYVRNNYDNQSYDLNWHKAGENQCAKITAWHGGDGSDANPSSTEWEIYHDGRQTFALGNYVYYDNSVTQWSNVYFRIGKWNVSQAYEMTKEPGTKDLYSYQRTGTAWEGYEVFNFADNWANVNGNVYYPDNDKSTWSGEETNFARESLSTNRYYKGESAYVTSSYAHYHTLNEISTYTVTTTSAEHCTVALQKCTNYGSDTYTDLSSGGTVLPTQYIKVTVTPSTGYEFSEVTVTGVGTITAAAAGTPGVYYVTGNATITATCTAKTCTVNFDNNGGTGGTNTVTATYGSAMPSKASNLPTRDGYTFDGYWDRETDNDGTGTQYYKADGTSKKNWNKDVTATQTLYAKWNCITPDAPTASDITATDGCGAAATFSAEIPSLPSYVTWYWQTSSGGTSTSNPASTDYTTDATAGSKTIYLRAKNTVCGSWSDAATKSATVRTAVTATWSTAPADGTVGGSMTASVTTNYSTGLRFSSSDATVASVDETSGAISYLKAGTTTITATVTGADSYCSTASVNKSITVSAAAGLTSIEENTLYQPLNMLCTGMSPLPGSDTYFTDDAYSTDNRFYYDVSSGNGPKAHTISEVTLGSGKAYEAAFTSEMWVKGTSTVTDGIPSAPSIKFLTPSTSGTLYLYIESGSCPVKFKKEDGTASNITSLTEVVSGKIYSTTVEANSVYYIYGNGGSNTGVYGLKLISCTTPAAPTAFSAGSISSTGATFTITDAANAASYDIYYSTSNSAPTASTAAIVTSDSKTKAVTGLTANTTYYAWVRSVCDADHKSAWVALSGSSFETSPAAATPILSWALATNSASWTATPTNNDETNLTDVATSTEHAAIQSGATSGKTCKISLSSSATPDKYVTFTFKVACGKKLTPSSVWMEVANVGGSSGGKMTHKAELSDTYGHTISATVVPASDGVLNELNITNGGGTYFQGEVTLKVWAWNSTSGGDGSAFRMGPNVKIFGEVANQASPAATITWNTQPANGQVGDPDFAYDVTCSDGSAVTVTSANTTYATIVGGKLHYAAAGTTHLVATATDACGNVVVQNSDNFIVSAAAPAGDCITITNFETSQHSNSSNKPDSQGKYIYGYKTTVDAEHAVTITTANTNNKGQNSNADMLVQYGTSIYIYADNTTTGGTPATFSNVTSVSLKVKNKHATKYSTLTVKVGSTTIANAVALSDANNSTYTTYTYDNLAQLSGKIEIHNGGSGSTDFNFFIDDIEICTSSLDACTTPVLPDLTNKTVCEGEDADAAWNATITNSGSLVSGETVAYSWVKKGGSTPVSSVATYQPTDVTEAMAGTYVVTATVSADGKASKSASQEVDLTVTEGTEAPTVTQSPATVYAGNSVTLTATATTGATYTWHTCNADGTGESSAISGATTNAYTIASAPAAGTHYYKVKVTGDGTHTCGNAETVYALTVSAAAGGDCFHYVSVIPTGSDIAISSNASIVTPTHATTLEGGTMKIGSSQVNITKNYGLKLESSKTVTITLDAALEAGNVVIVKGTSAAAGYGVTINGVNFYETESKTFNVSYTVLADDGLEGKTVLTVSRYSGNSYLQEIKITGCGTACTDPEVTASVNNSTACVGTSVTFTATGAHASATYQWQKLDGTWTNISDATASTTYTIPSVVAGDAGKYRVIASHNCNRTSNEVTLNVPSAPNFGSTVPASVSVMQTIALSINTVEATDATKYKWYKSADLTWDAGDTEIGTNKELIKAYDGEAIGSPSYYIFCRAQNACGITTSTAIAVNVTAYVEEDCATKGNEGDAEFGFENTGCGSGNFPNTSTPCWNSNSKSKYLTYTAPEGKYLKTAKVTVAVSSGSKCGYAYSTDGGTTWTYAELASLSSTLTEKTINLNSLSGTINAFRISRNLQDGGGTDHGVTSGNFYLSKACFEYTDACTATTVTVSPTSKTYTIGNSWTAPTITLGPVAVASETLTYTSSDEDIATVDDDGTVNFQGRAGSVTITASYAGGEVGLTDYCASEGSYTITVSCSGDAPKIVEASTVDLSGCNISVVLNAKEQDGTTDFTGGSYQWLRNGEEIDGATNKSYTATQAGIYTVEYTSAGGCTSVSTNSAVVTSETTEPEVERLVPFQYYHVNKTYSDQMKMRHLFTVKNSGTLDGKHFKMYVSRNGAAATDVTSSNALVVVPNGDGHVDTVMVDLNKLSGKYAKGDELVYTCKAIDCESHVSETYKSTIQMHVIDTDTATLALICSGSNKASGTRKTSELTVGGDFLTGYNVADLCEQTGNTSFDANTEWGLYTKLKTQYIVTPVNGYAVFNKLNYEPFDILLLTDYPKASKSDAAATVLDDMADLCDYRPMLSFKAHMVAKTPSKWAAKGFTTSPVVPKNTRTRLNIVCYAHPMFKDIKGSDVARDYDDGSQIVYTMLTGAGYESSKGMQGFHLAAAENFVTIGLVHYNATATDDYEGSGNVKWTPGSGDEMLVAAAERQENIEARMIFFSLNCGAQSKLTAQGETVVLKCLEYLLNDATIEGNLSDCSLTFDNKAGDGNWNTSGNWGPDHVTVPGQYNAARIAAPATVDIPHAKALELRIMDGGSVTIPAGSGLEIKSTIRHLDGKTVSPTEESDIHIGSGASGNGTLIFNNNTGDTKAQVDMYSKGFIDGSGVKNYQYMGTPFIEVNALYNYYGSWIYYWKADGSGWKAVKNGGPMTAWTGYCITQEAPTYHQMSGTLTATGTVDINVPANANMVVGNSWTAPIDINALTTDDLEGLTANIYFFNTGVDKTGNAGAAGSRYAGSTYVTVPVEAARYEGEDDHINSLQGFFVKNPNGSAGTLHLDYERHVRKTTRGSIIGDALHAPARRTALSSDEPVVLKMKVSGENYDDKLLLLEREDFTEGFDNGWDGDKWDGNESALYIYTTDNNGTENSVSAIPELEGTVIGFRAGEDDAYTLNFEYLNSDEPLYLYDVENNTYTQIMTGMTYRFFTTDNEKHARFIITRSNGQEVATGVEPTSGSLDRSKAKKLLIEDKMFIMVNGMLYDATGKVVK